MTEFIINNFLIIAVSLFSMSILISILPNQYSKWIHISTTILTSIGSFLGFVYAMTFFFNETRINFEYKRFFELFDITLYIDKLNVIFLAILFFVTFTSALFGYNYVKQFFGKYRIGLLSLNFNIFILSMLAVIMSQSIFPFLFAWELMSISSFFIVIFENDKKSKVKAGLLYIIFTQIGVLFIIAALLLLGQSSASQTFTDFARADETTKLIASVLLIIGLGAKAGLIPFHIWLPEAHPAAPSHLSAVISGVMLKVAIFVMIEFFLIFIRVSTEWLGISLIIIGLITAILGAMYAFVVKDIKKLVAYSSIENVGIITTLLGMTMLFLTLYEKSFDIYTTDPSTFPNLGYLQLFGLSFIVMLFHIINHSIYKSALFQSTGVVTTVYGTRNLNKLGGIAKTLPVFTMLFILLSLAISALPPFNGFASEWLAIQTMIGGLFATEPNQILYKLLFVITAAGLIITGAFTAGAFLKTIGVGFLGVNRQGIENIDSKKKYLGVSTYISLGISVVVSILLGLFSHAVVFNLSDQIFGKDISGAPIFEFSKTVNITMPITQGNLSNIILFTFIILFILVCLFITNIYKTKNKTYLTWDCGRPVNARMQYTAVGFSDNLRQVFRSIYFPINKKEIVKDEKYNYTNYIPKKIVYIDEYIKIYHKYIYDPIYKIFIKVGNIIKRLQSGKITTYVIYILITLLICLLIATNV